MKKTFNLEFFLDNKNLFHDDLISIRLEAGKANEITILPNHISLITTLLNTEINLKLKTKQVKSFKVNQGIFYFHENQAKIIALSKT